MTRKTVPEGVSFPLMGLVRLALAERALTGWELCEDDFWCRVNPPEQERRRQGWKLHVSTTVLAAPETLYRAAGVLLDHGCAFKFAARSEYVVKLTSRNYDRAQCGKFITVYPRDDTQFRELAEALDRATAGLPGPAVLSDRAYRRGSAVHYRYGAFQGAQVLTNDGVMATRIVTPDGVPVDDPRKPWFSPPEWAPLPFPGPPGRAVNPKPRSVLLRDRYVVNRAIMHTARGGVYRGVDRTTGRDVVIKQARSHVGALHDGRDARDQLRDEAVALTRLSGLAAELVEVFDQDEHTFLVESVVPGVPMSRWVTDCAPDGEGPPVRDVRMLAGRLADLIGEVHSRGLVFRDLSPNNIMVDDECQVRFIDPELAVAEARWAYRSYTPGYAAPEYLALRPYDAVPGPAIDLYALGAVLFVLVTGVHPVFAPDRTQGAVPPDGAPVAVGRTQRDRMELVLQLTAPGNEAVRALAPAVLGLCADDPAERWTLDRLRSFLAADEFLAGGERAVVTAPREPGTPASSLPAAPPAPPLDTLISDGLTYLVTTMSDDDSPRLWSPGDFGSLTDPVNVQHGVSGILATLVQASAVTGRADVRAAAARAAAWLGERIDRQAQPLPGLFFGRAGAAWALFDAASHLGESALADKAVEVARRVPVRWPNPDVFHGAAGAGLTQLHFWRATGSPEFLSRAEECADGLLAASTITPDGPVWPVPLDFDSAMAGISHLGYAHGIAGVGTFLLAAARATGRDDLREAAVAAGGTLCATAERGPWGARWRTDYADEPGGGIRYHLCSGASGIGTFLLRLWRETGDPRLWDLVELAARAVHGARWTSGTALCHGLAGNGEFLLDVAETEPSSLRWATDLASCLYARHAIQDGLMVVPGETGVDVTADHGVGLAGVLTFLLRHRYGGQRLWLADEPAGLAVAGSAAADIPLAGTPLAGTPS